MKKKNYKTYFIVSDTHSFYTPLQNALNEKGFDISNKNHILVINGDLFDRGDETNELYKFVKSLKNRVILIKGNHEDLLRECLDKKYPQEHDFTNGTVKTLCALYSKSNGEELSSELSLKSYIWGNDYINFLDRLWDKIRTKIKKSNFYKWINSDKWLNYLELGDYIITHSFLPLRIKEDTLEKYKEYGLESLIYYKQWDLVEYNSNWRNDTSEEEWKSARWGCPYEQLDEGLFKEENKTLICGHWHSSEFHKHYENKENDYSTYYGKNIIAIDGCTVLSKKVNCIIIEESKEGYRLCM